MHFRRQAHQDRLNERGQRIPTFALVDLMGQADMVDRTLRLFPGASLVEAVLVCTTEEEATQRTWDLLARIIPKDLPKMERLHRGAAVLEDALEKMDWRCTAPPETCEEVARRLRVMLNDLRRRMGA